MRHARCPRCWGTILYEGLKEPTVCQRCSCQKDIVVAPRAVILADPGLPTPRSSTLPLIDRVHRRTPVG